MKQRIQISAIQSRQPKQALSTNSFYAKFCSICFLGHLGRNSQIDCHEAQNTQHCPARACKTCAAQPEQTCIDPNFAPIMRTNSKSKHPFGWSADSRLGG